MKSVLLTTVLVLFCCAITADASAKVSCDDVRASIETKLTTKGVKKFTLEVVPKDQVTDLRIVGTCDGGAKKITYKRD